MRTKSLLAGTAMQQLVWMQAQQGSNAGVAKACAPVTPLLKADAE
jgi:hypothetical protein